jgi:hypothetical protein
MTDYFDLLSDEVIENIVFFLDPHDLAHFAQVSKRLFFCFDSKMITTFLKSLDVILVSFLIKS